MTVDLLVDNFTWPTLPSGLVWPAVFWGVLAVLATLEAWIPAIERPPQRRERWETNIGLGLVNGLMAPLAPVSAVIAAEWALGQGIGIINRIDAPLWAAFAATFAGRSLAGYAFHVTMHKIPLLWRLHRVHHLDTHLDATTGLRSHPFEYALSIVTMASLAVALGFSPAALVVYEIVEGLMNLASHTNLRLPRWPDRVLRLLLVTPNMHCVHHSSYRPETDSNYGGVLSIWDRVFGTYRSEPTHAFNRMQIGLEEVRDERASNLWWQIKSPALAIPRAINSADS
jgi:sterol desaturase/sphingolipid hydroxylase (fatty acid hydroxylase superfamily)